MSDAIDRFQIRVDDSVLSDLRSRLAQTRFPDQIEGTGWEYGAPIDYVRELVEYWRDKYDWRAQEARLNELAHFRTRIDGQSIHFIHARSSRADALPLLIVHGWPGSVLEFLDVIPRLTDPEAHGGRTSDAFHVIAPSLPGYGFSEPTRTRGWDPWRIARAFIELMRRLGYTPASSPRPGRRAPPDGRTTAPAAGARAHSSPTAIRRAISRHATDTPASSARRRSRTGKRTATESRARTTAPGPSDSRTSSERRVTRGRMASAPLTPDAPRSR